MPCTSPIKAYIDNKPTYDGKKLIKFYHDKTTDEEIMLDCGRCMSCRLKKSLEWSLRIVHESQLYRHNCFITLTYNDETLPPTRTLVKQHFRNFMKRFRKEFHDKKIRYFMCGEYGTDNGRPHYHAILFNFDFGDKFYWKKGKRGDKIYRSETLERLWKNDNPKKPHYNTDGWCYIGNVKPESAAYVARYNTKKITGEKAYEHYAMEEEIIDFDTGEHYASIYHHRTPEYCGMSKGIGKDWFLKNTGDCFPKDFITLQGVKLPIPRYYNTLFADINPELLEQIKSLRTERRKEHELEYTDARLEAEERIKKRQHEMLTRN